MTTIRRSFLPVGVVMAALLNGAAPGAAIQKLPSEQSVYVSVVNPGDWDSPVKNLKAEDFTISEDGVVREIVRVERATAPAAIAVLSSAIEWETPPMLPTPASTTRIPSPNFDAAKARAYPNIDREIAKLLAVSPGTVVSFSAQMARPAVGSPGFTSDLAAATKAATNGDVGWPYAGADAIVRVCDVLASMPADRRIIVINTYTPELDAAAQQRVRDALVRANVELWAVERSSYSPIASQASTTLWARQAQDQADVVSASGGRYVFPPAAGWHRGWANVADLVAAQYRVTYRRPTGAAMPARLNVAVPRKKMDVAATTWASRGSAVSTTPVIAADTSRDIASASSSAPPMQIAALTSVAKPKVIDPSIVNARAQAAAGSAVSALYWRRLTEAFLSVAPGSTISFSGWTNGQTRGGFSADAATAIELAGRPEPTVDDPHSHDTATPAVNVVHACDALIAVGATHAVVIITSGFPDGKDESTVWAALQRAHAQLWVVARGVETDFESYTPGFSDERHAGVSSASSDFAVGLGLARKIAEETGGRYLEASDKISLWTVPDLLAAPPSVTSSSRTRR